MRARAPASTANLGPGFDALAIALNRYVQVEIEPASSLTVHSVGEGAGMADNATHLAVCVAKEVLGHDRIAVAVHSQIPVSRGLGSSAALAVAAAAAAGADDPFVMGAIQDGHAENAAASAHGGLVSAAMIKGEPAFAHLPLSGDLAFVVIVPERLLSTVEARRVLPDSFSRTDATFNLGRMGFLLAGLADPSQLRPEAAEDRIHQHARSELFPEAPSLLAALLGAGALASSWSGAGPSLLGICTTDSAPHVQAGARQALEDSGLGGTVLLLQADRRGVVYGEEAELPV